MKKHLFTLLPLVSTVGLSGQAIAENDPPKWSVGVLGLYEQTPFSAEKDRYMAFPYLSYRGDKFFIQGPNIGYHLFATDKTAPISIEVDLLAAMRSLPGRSRNKITVDGGVATTIGTKFGKLKLDALHDITDTSNGIELKANYSYGFNFDRLMLSPSVGISWKNRKLTNYLWGVTPEQHADMIERKDTVLPIYIPNDDTVTYSVGLNSFYRINDNWSLVGIMNYEFLNNTITDNPGIDKDYNLTTAFGVTYSF